MTSDPTTAWTELNDRFLQVALERVQAALAHALGGAAEEVAGLPEPEELLAGGPGGPLPALAVLCRTFDLSAFERDLLVLAAAPDLQQGFEAFFGGGDSARRAATLGLALTALPGVHWNALAPDAALRYWRLVELGRGETLTSSPLRVEERVLHFLRGLHSPEDRLAGLAEPLAAGGGLVPSHRRLAERLAAAWARAEGRPPVVQLCGDDVEGQRAVAAAAGQALGLNVQVLDAAGLPAAAGELDGLIRLLSREAALGHHALLLDCTSLDASDAARERALATLADGFRGALLVATRNRRALGRRPALTFDVAPPETAEQAALWRSCLGERGESANGCIEALTAQFQLGAAAIRAASVEALERVAAEGGDEAAPELGQCLWQACLAQARPGIDALAQRILPAAGWDDLVLPAAQKELLRDVAVQVRQRHRVYQDWGFAARSSRGLGISALFAGPSGTGKTMAAEVLASELQLDLYRIDLASVVSKYIGETEKNLKRIFDAAETGGAILLFDEADALFGKRSEVKDSHDRYANIEVSYLLQRMEGYRGLAVLTTNLRNALDPAFLRRLRFVVQFPFPDAPQRAEIWRRVFPAQTPTEALDVDQLARLAVSGGNIRNIALGAAFLAAEDATPVRMEHVLRAARSEYAKLEKPLTGVEIGGWSG